ncbi:hypothetical protein CPLU01_07495 [Colletotrichum plurivorum]|uniref:RRM domain-containing protein n=1 Tax=Colletotrichum plurivorum TaxID=2175906 RepID=A0A8H6KGB4_9PEZI|nr:hypothetical protein CPLU01_07495 [Colletotrichum plurivorum]
MQSAMVPPGPETGVYYIPICNVCSTSLNSIDLSSLTPKQLPFDTKWRPLKEWLCNDCEVDYVQIFTISTSGWIRVLGPYNFYAACDRMKEGVFNGRRIMYDDRNLTSPVLIKNVLDSNASPVSSVSRLATRPPPPAFAPTHHLQSSAYSYSSSPELSYDQWSLDAAASGQGYQVAPQVLPPETTWYPESAPCYESYANAAEADVAVENRRVIIRRIGHGVSDEQVKTLVKQALERVTPAKEELQRIDVPRGSGNQTKGCAFAVFRTPGVARSVAETLDGKTWNSRRLEARLTNEGSADERPSHVSQGSSSRHRKGGDSSRKKRSTDRPKEPAPSASGESSSSCQSRSQETQAPVIADGTSRGCRSGSNEKRRK